MKIGLFYGSTTCYSEMTAEKMQAFLGEELVDIYNIKDSGLAPITQYDIVILGISTWDYGELQEDWEALWDDIDQFNLNDKVVALYGQGDQEGYTDWFVDAMGLLHDKILPLGPQIVGYWPNTGYEFNESKALTQDRSHFVGLALDDECQFDLSEERINEWLAQVLEEVAQLD
ncbi:flavodoxin FldB [Psychrobium sp. 1_MG-2023]|uniref:flavodoxin FldB n=1 Tax=Psychrobium sp. 1_MG-2023 TaxID=3062624 RepID=UPI000C347BF5|nr:flavodoxin FldB [Psychrobium sp. 1_MG-2023]MDP2560052.1 flavodoxin FldB [Psychrobium sp. 1_MG-2023]PKF56287.1 flavodoxin FldB [Alteromonadales bacterium alter-6D02]